MHPGQPRDEKTLIISTALFIFVGLAVVGTALLVAAHAVLGLDGSIAGALSVGVYVGAGVVAIRYLVHHGRI